jgi:hypothetical protein
MILPNDAAPLLAALAPHFTQPTFGRFTTLMAAAILTTGRRTVANLRRTLGGLASGHVTSDQRVLSAARWSSLAVGCALTRFLLTHVLPAGPVSLVGDDPVDGHPGPHVVGKARHRDAVRSSHAYTAGRYGHKWVVLAVPVRFPFAPRPWAVPVLVALYRPPDVARRAGGRPRTPAPLMTQLLRVLLRQFPDRRFVVAGDSAYGTHEVVRFVHRFRARLTLGTKCHPDLNLFRPPPPKRGPGRPRVKGDRVPKPRAAGAARRRRTRLTVPWSGGGTRDVAVVTGTGHWYKAGHGRVPIRWVFVADRTGTHRDEYLLTTDTALAPRDAIAHYGGRWDIETTFPEWRSALGLETTRGWCRATVLRAAPCLFGLYAVVAILFAALPAAHRKPALLWPGKTGVTFSDALTAVRQRFWRETVFREAPFRNELAKLTPKTRNVLLAALAPAT